ncbi:MAG: pseudouridine synthase [Armatimonadota bacterium]|nr:pseudouridine synthase [Armatimonadota bacterium]MDR5697654.1 pseudouridine synthase [Armatimonadota bacterium]
MRNRGERLHKVIAASGLASRRAAEALIRAGRVSVNGRTAMLGQTVTANDEVRVDGRPLPPPRRLEYWALHKPAGYVSTLHDPAGRPKARDLVPSRTRLFSVGRLDLNSEGLLLFTNDGELAHRLMHPRYGVPRTYRARVRGMPSRATLDRLRRGVSLPDGHTGPIEAAIERPAGNHTWLRVTLREGRHREVRRVLEAVGHPVARLIRVAYGPVRLTGLPPGAARPLTPAEIARLRRTPRTP